MHERPAPAGLHALATSSSFSLSLSLSGLVPYSMAARCSASVVRCGAVGAGVITAAFLTLRAQQRLPVNLWICADAPLSTAITTPSTPTLRTTHGVERGSAACTL